jgi:DNA-binding NtrC family response regulator
MTVTTPNLTADRFDDARILIVEDEPFIAWDLAQAVESAGGIVIGPAATLAQALALVQASVLEAAILDVNLPDGHIGPVLETLRPHVAVIIHSGVGLPPEIRERFPSVPFYFKPTPTGVLTTRLASSLNGRP